MELYNPPLVDRSSISQINSLYMNAQMKLLEKEYGIKMSYYDQKKDKNKNTNNQNNNNQNNNNDNININSINNKSEEESSNKNNSREVLNLDDIEIDTRRALKQQENDGHDNNDDNSVKILVNKRNKGRTFGDLNPENKQHFNTLDLSEKSSERKFKYNKTEYDDK